jgi:hypothetical protein
MYDSNYFIVCYYYYYYDYYYYYSILLLVLLFLYVYIKFRYCVCAVTWYEFKKQPVDAKEVMMMKPSKCDLIIILIN